LLVAKILALTVCCHIVMVNWLVLVLPLLTSVNRFAWGNKFLMNSVITFQKRSTCSWYTVWFSVYCVDVVGTGFCNGRAAVWFLVFNSNSAFLFCSSDAVLQSLKQNLTQVCCSFISAFGKWQIALTVNCCWEAVQRACSGWTH
jgi:hypothetical protein